jgi:hypothetical protein
LMRAALKLAHDSGTSFMISRRRNQPSARPLNRVPANLTLCVSSNLTKSQ